MRAEFLIVGQGLAGTALAWRLLERGRTFLIVDPDEPLTCSKVAAGLVTPITGMRLTLNWRYPVLYPEAVRFYREKERLLGGKFFFPRPVVWLFKNEREQEIWQRRLEDPEVRRVVNSAAPSSIVDESCVANDRGGFQLKHAGFLDTGAYLSASRLHFQSLGAWQKGSVSDDDLAVTEDGVRWRDETFGSAVFCQGWEAAKSRWFSWLPYCPAQGTILTLRGSSGERRRIINRGCWVVPRADGTLRAGSSFDLQFDQPHTPCDESVRELEQRLGSLLQSDFEVADRQTAVRPIVKHCKAAIGRHPAHPRLACLLGLGSKGVLRSPFLARRLVDHLLDGASLDREFDVQSNL